MRHCPASARHGQAPQVAPLAGSSPPDDCADLQPKLIPGTEIQGMRKAYEGTHGSGTKLSLKRTLARQYWEHAQGLTPNLEMCLRFLAAAAAAHSD